MRQKEKEGETDRQTDRHRQPDRQTQRQGQKELELRRRWMTMTTIDLTRALSIHGQVVHTVQ